MKGPKSTSLLAMSHNFNSPRICLLHVDQGARAAGIHSCRGELDSNYYEVFNPLQCVPESN